MTICQDRRFFPYSEMEDSVQALSLGIDLCAGPGSSQWESDSDLATRREFSPRDKAILMPNRLLLVQVLSGERRGLEMLLCINEDMICNMI